MDKKNYLKGIAILQTVPSFKKEISPETIEGYWIALEDMPDPDYEKAIKRCLRECKFLPTPADIREGFMPKYDPDEPAIIAWSKVVYARKAKNEGGRHNGVLAFDDLNIHRAIPLVDTWENIRDCDDEKLPFIEKKFIKCYNITARNPENHPCPRTVGVDGNYPLFIGNKEIAENNFNALTIKKKEGK